MKKRWWQACLLAILLPELLCGLLMLFGPGNIDYSDGDIDRNRLDIITEAFTWALTQNRVDIARNIVDEAQWERLDRWTVEHPVDDCNTWAQVTDEWTHSSSTVIITKPDGTIRDKGIFFEEPANAYPINTTATVNLYAMWWCGDYVWIHDLAFRWTEEGWLVDDWGEIEN